MKGIDPYAYLNQISLNMEQLTQRERVGAALDEVEYLFEVIPPELRDLAEAIIGQLRRRLYACS